MTAPTPPTIQELREELNQCMTPHRCYALAASIFDRLEAAEALNLKLRERFLDLEDVVDWKGLFTAEKLVSEKLAFLVEHFESSQQPRPMEDAPDNDFILALHDNSWLEVIREDGQWCSSILPGARLSPSIWVPLPGQSEKNAAPSDELLPMHSDVPDAWLIRQRDGDEFSWWKEHGRGLVTDILTAGIHTEADARHAVKGRPSKLEAVRLSDAIDGMRCKGTVAGLLGWLPDTGAGE